MATWGSQTWGFSNWGTLGDQAVELSGVQLNSQQGNVDQGSNPGWGAQYWGAGEWGDLASPEVQVTGIQLNSNTEAVNTQADGLVVTANDNTKVIALNNVVAGTSILQTVSGIQSTAEHGSVFAGEVVAVQVTSASNEAWGENAWSDGGWGVGDGQTISIGDTSVALGQQIDAQGQELTVSLTDVLAGISIIAEPTSATANVTTGTLSFESKYLIGSAEATTTVNSVDTQANSDVDVTGQELTGSTGQLEYEAKYLVTNGSENVVEFTAYNQAQLSTAQAKFGTASLLLDGTNDYVESNSNVDLSSGDFTVDVWIRPSSVSGYKGIWQSGTSTTEQSYLLGSTVYWTVNPSTIISSSVTVNANEWTMLSYERQGNTHRLYKNGTLEDTATTSNKQDNGRFSIGENGFGDFNGYIDEFRLSNIARYGGSSFTEPTGAFVPDSNTTFLLHMDGANGSTNIVDDAPGVTIARFDIGEAFGGEVVEVQVRTASAQPWGNEAWGNGEWGQSVGTDIAIGADTVLTPSIDVPVTGEDINTTAANVSITADANLSLTGQELESLLGNENAFSDVTVEITGQLLTSEQGDVLAGISQLIIPTGLEATVTSGTMGVNAWAVVDPNASTTWSVVDKAAA